ncbi:MAG: hypothetical protein KGO50_06605, partial [Myxococcales bacterium]|nr:hypothetical protein [Myxococcales bacterium]
MNQKYGFAALLCTLLCAACGDEGTPANTTTEPDTGGRPTGDVGTTPDEDDARSPDAATDAGSPDVEADSASPVEDATVPPDDAVDGGDPDAEPADDTATPDTFAPDASGAALGSPCESNADCASGLCIDTTGGVEPGICSTACESDDDCSVGYSCYSLTLEGVAVLGVCLPETYCSDPDEDGYGKGPGCLGEDCEEGAPDIYPGAAEACDGLDNDCNDQVDDAVTGLAASCSTAELGLCAVGAEQC